MNTYHSGLYPRKWAKRIIQKTVKYKVSFEKMNVFTQHEHLALYNLLNNRTENNVTSMKILFTCIAGSEMPYNYQIGQASGVRRYSEHQKRQFAPNWIFLFIRFPFGVKRSTAPSFWGKQIYYEIKDNPWDLALLCGTSTPYKVTKMLVFPMWIF